MNVRTYSAYVLLLSGLSVAKKKRISWGCAYARPHFFKCPVHLVIIGLLIDETMLTLSPLFCFAGSTGLSKVSSVKSCLNLVSLVKTLHKVFHWPAATGCPDIWVRWTFGGYVSRNGSASRRTGGGHAASSTSAQKTISLTLTSPRQRSRKSWGCAFAIINKALTSFCFCKRTLLKDALFLTREGGHVHVTESTNPTPVSVVTSPSCVGADSVDDFHIDSVHVLKQKPCLCTRWKSLCKHYLLSAQYRLSNL